MTGRFGVAMITREELRRIPILDRQIKRDKEQLRYLEEKATSIPSGLTEGERIQNSVTNNAGRLIDEATDFRREIEEKRRELRQLKNKAGKFIETIPEARDKRIIRLRYIACMSWMEVADIAGYDIAYVQKLARKITEDLE